MYCLYELSVCGVNDKSAKRKSEETWLKSKKNHPARLQQSTDHGNLLNHKASMPATLLPQESDDKNN